MQKTGVISGSPAELGEAWDGLHAAAPTPFTGRMWLDTLAGVFGRSVRLTVSTADGRPVAGIPVCLARKGPLAVSPPLPISLYSGYLGSTDAEHLGPVRDAVERQCNFCVLQLPAGMSSTPFIEHGWRAVTQRSRMLDVHDPERLWAEFSQSLRRKIRRAAERGYSLTEDVPLDRILTLYERSYHRHSLSPPVPLPRMRAWLSRIAAMPGVGVYGVRAADGSVPAFRMVLRKDTAVFDWLAGGDETVAHPSASHWLLGEVLRAVSAAGARTFDFMGVNTPGISAFKELFGGSEVRYDVVSWYRPGVLRRVEQFRNSLALRRRRLR